jgi:hypothetical protein
MSANISPFPNSAERSADVLLEKLQDPRVVGSLVSLLEKSTILNDFLERGEELLNRISKGVGEFGRVGVTALNKSLQTVDLDDLKASAGQLQGMLPAVRTLLGELVALEKAGLFDPAVVQTLGRIGRAMSSAAQDPEAHSKETRGIFNMTGLLKDPEIAQTINFFVSFARHFGGELSQGEVGSAKK